MFDLEKGTVCQAGAPDLGSDRASPAALLFSKVGLSPGNSALVTRLATRHSPRKRGVALACLDGSAFASYRVLLVRIAQSVARPCGVAAASLPPLAGGRPGVCGATTGWWRQASRRLVRQLAGRARAVPAQSTAITPSAARAHRRRDSLRLPEGNTASADIVSPELFGAQQHHTPRTTGGALPLRRPVSSSQRKLA